MQRNIATAVGITVLFLAAVAVLTTLAAPDVPPPEPDNPPTRVARAGNRGPMVRADPLEGTRPAAPDLPNVVLVIGCTIRKDQTSLYNDALPTTPWLEDLARAGTRFDDLVAAAPWTRPASTAILTGQHAVSIGMVEPRGQRSNRTLHPSVDTLADHLRRGGYTTIGGTANPNLNAVFGFHQGFDAYYEAAGLWRKGALKVPGANVVSEVLSLLDANHTLGRPFFLQVMLIDAHAPVQVRAEAALPWALPDEPIEVAKYRVALNRFDMAARSLDEGLQQRGFDPSNTVVVMVADHGEGLFFPEHHGKGHGNFLYPSTVEVPWVARGPGIARGHRVQGLASQVDVLPTILGLLDLEGYSGPGQDWSAALRGDRDRTARTRAWADTWYHSSERSAVYTDAVACQQDFAPARGRKAKRPRREGTFETGCFPRSDPTWDQSTEAPELQEALRRWHEARVAEYDAYAHKDNADLDQDLSDQLEALGYLE